MGSIVIVTTVWLAIFRTSHQLTIQCAAPTCTTTTISCGDMYPYWTEMVILINIIYVIVQLNLMTYRQGATRLLFLNRVGRIFFLPEMLFYYYYLYIYFIGSSYESGETPQRTNASGQHMHSYVIFLMQSAT